MSSLSGAIEQAAGSLLNTITQYIGSAATQVTSLMTPQQSASLSPSLFSTGPKDDLITQDIYGVTTENPINNVDQLAGQNPDLISAFASATGQIGNLSGLLSASASGVALDPSTLLTRVQNAITNFSGTYTTLPPNMVAAAANQSVLTNNQYPNITTTVNGVISTVSTTDLAGAQGLIDTINAISGNPALASYMDVGASSALMSVVMQEALSLGISGVVPALVATAMNSQVASNALTANAAYAVRQCDLETIGQIATLLGPGYIKSQVPNSAVVMLANYKLPPGATTNQYMDLYSKLMTRINQIDPGWDTTIRNGHALIRLDAFTNMSADAKRLFRYIGAYGSAIMVAAFYPSMGLVDQAKAQYPYMRVLPTTTQYVALSPSTPGVYIEMA